LPTGRYDRYSNEYARYIWDAAQIAGRKDLLDALRPTLKTQMKLWWDLVAADGYGYPWGRSLGLVSYLDTLEIPGFLALNPEFRPAPLEQLAAEYYRAWQWLRKDFKDDRHLLSLFDFGRGNFSYISIDREWQQTTGALGKLADAHMRLMKGHHRRARDHHPRRAFAAGGGALRVLQINGEAGGRVARAPGADPLRAAVHNRHSAGCRRLSARAAWTAGICSALSNSSFLRWCRFSSSRTGERSPPPTARTRLCRPQMGAACARTGISGPWLAGKPGERARRRAAERRRVDARRRHDRARPSG
jgi:hypothetical protein